MEAPSKPRDFAFPNAEKLLNQEHTCLKVSEQEYPLCMPPRYLGKETKFVKLILDTKLGKYNEQLESIPVSYKRIRRLGNTGIISGEDPSIYFKIIADFIVFKPDIGNKLKAKVEQISKSHVGILIHDWFNGSIKRDSVQVEELNEGDEVLVEVKRTYISKRILCIECQLLDVLYKAPMPEGLLTGSRRVFEECDPDLMDYSLLDEGGDNVATREDDKTTPTIESDSGIDHGKITPDKAIDISTSSPKNRKKRKVKDPQLYIALIEEMKEIKQEQKLSTKKALKVINMDSKVFYRYLLIYQLYQSNKVQYEQVKALWEKDDRKGGLKRLHKSCLQLLCGVK